MRGREGKKWQTNKAEGIKQSMRKMGEKMRQVMMDWQIRARFRFFLSLFHDGMF